MRSKSSFSKCILEDGINCEELEKILDNERQNIKDINFKIDNIFLLRYVLDNENIAKKFIKRGFDPFLNDIEGCILQEILANPSYYSILEYFININGEDDRFNQLIVDQKAEVERDVLEICLSKDNIKAFEKLLTFTKQNLLYNAEENEYNFLSKAIILSSNNIFNSLVNDNKLMPCKINLYHPFLQAIIRGKANMVQKLHEQYYKKCNYDICLKNIGKKFEETFNKSTTILELSAFLGNYELFKLIFNRNKKFNKQLLNKISDVSILKKNLDPLLLNFDKKELLLNKKKLFEFIQTDYYNSYNLIKLQLTNLGYYKSLITIIIDYLCEVSKSEFQKEKTKFAILLKNSN